MLKLFANVFGRSDDAPSGLPQSLVKALVERAVDGTDPRVRIVSGYAKTLRQSVTHAADHLIGLIDSLPEPLSLGSGSLSASPLLSALFYSESQMKQILDRDAALLEFRKANPSADGPVTALLVVQRGEKRGFGYGQVGDQTLKDVSRTTVGFTGHHLLEPTLDELETRRGLKRRAFDQLLTVALAEITERREEREELAGHLALLRDKREIMRRGGSFQQHTGADEQARLQARLDEIEQKLSAMGPAEDVLEGNLRLVSEVLTGAEHHLWLEQSVLCLDKFYVVHDQPAPSAPQIVFNDLHESDGRQVSLQLVRIEPS